MDGTDVTDVVRLRKSVYGGCVLGPAAESEATAWESIRRTVCRDARRGDALVFAYGLVVIACFWMRPRIIHSVAVDDGRTTE